MRFPSVKYSADIEHTVTWVTSSNDCGTKGQMGWEVGGIGFLGGVHSGFPESWL